jgi:serine/threonine protein kinase
MLPGAGTLHSLLDVDQLALTLRIRARLAAEICDGLTHIHSKGVIHRNLQVRAPEIQSHREGAVIFFNPLVSPRICPPPRFSRSS